MKAKQNEQSLGTVGILVVLLTALVWGQDGQQVLSEGRIIYVDQSARGDINGESWDTAFRHLQDALAVARVGQEIRVAQGIYVPYERTGTSGGELAVDRFATFSLPAGVITQGGYGGVRAEDPNERDIERYLTVLSGDLLANDQDKRSEGAILVYDPPNPQWLQDNCYHVVTATEIGRDTVLDGFMIADGYIGAEDSRPEKRMGAGLLVLQASPTIQNCVFVENGTFAHGGAVACLNGEPRFEACRFEGNYAQIGAGVAVMEGKAEFRYCAFSLNHAGLHGGALYNGAGQSNLINCLVTCNQAGNAGAGVFCGANDVSILCSTFTGNRSPIGSGIASDSRENESRARARVSVTNSILWDSDTELFAHSLSSISVDHSDVFGARVGTGNIDADPQFLFPWGEDGLCGTDDDDLRLTETSPCIGQGSNEAVPEELVIDMDGFPRIEGRAVDMGAYESGYYLRVWYVSQFDGDDENNGQTEDTAFGSIQHAIDQAGDTDTIRVYPGVYHGEVDLQGKALALEGIPTQEGIAILEHRDDFVLSLHRGEGPDTVVRNFVIREGLIGVFLAGTSPTLENLTVINNSYGIEAYADADPLIRNCILWKNTDSDLFGCQALYSCVDRLEQAVGPGNFSADPLFMNLLQSDYHLRSTRGSFLTEYGLWILDEVTSPCIDAGDPISDVRNERQPNNDLINTGAYGGTSYASLTANIPPIVFFAELEEGDYVQRVTNGSELRVIAHDVDGSIAKVEFFIDNEKIGEDTDPEDGWQPLTIPFLDRTAEVVVSVVVTDDDGATSSVSIPVMYGGGRGH